MKQCTKMSRTVQMLEKAFNMLNADWFDSKLETPIITIIPTPRAYAHYTTCDMWDTSKGEKHEINLGAGTLNRPIEDIIASLMHEMVHANNNEVLHVQDCSSKNQYHNKIFAREAEKHGLNVERHSLYGYAITSCGDALLQWCLDNADVLNEIEICRKNPVYGAIGIGGKAASGAGNRTPSEDKPKYHVRKYQCPKCRNSVRATKDVNIICADCMQLMLLA